MKRALALLALWAPLALAEEPRPVDAPSRFAEADAAYTRRDDPAELEKLRASLAAAEQAGPADFELMWRLAQLYSWLSDDPAIQDAEKSKLGKKGWDYAEKAITLEPGRVEGWHFAAVNMGQYSLGIGILRALSQGIEGKFKDRLSHAEKLDPAYSNGAIPTAWGRFWFKLPWPKYDGRKSETALKAALALNPDNVRARVYLADLYEKEDEDAKARAELERAADGEPGRYDAPEERRYQAVARQKLARTGKR